MNNSAQSMCLVSLGWGHKTRALVCSPVGGEPGGTASSFPCPQPGPGRLESFQNAEYVDYL